MSGIEHDEQWRLLRAERAAARAALLESVDAIEARASDPLRLRERMRKHPVLFTVAAAAAGALLVKLLMGGRDAEPRRDEHDAETRAHDHEPDFMDTLRVAALRVATPWVRKFVDEHLGGEERAGEAAATNGSRTESPPS